MTEPLYWVVAIKLLRKGRRYKTVDRQGPMTQEQAREARDTLRSLGVKGYVYRSVKDRTSYYAAYHKRRHKDDPEYRERKRASALAWARRETAAAKGDISPWLSQS